MPEILQAAEIAGQPSIDDIRRLLRKAIFGDGEERVDGYILEFSTENAVVSMNDRYFRYPYALKNGTVEVAAPVEVVRTWRDTSTTQQAGEEQSGLVFSGDGTRRYFVTELGEQFGDPDPEGKVRQWVQICRDGKWQHPSFGAVVVNQQFREALVSNFRNNVRQTRIPTDYDHVTKGPASGWYQALENRGNALFGEIEFTPTAVAKVKAGEYRYFSPEWDANYADGETGKKHGPTLLGGGLVNRPFFRGMQPLTFSEPDGAQPQELPMPEIVKGEETTPVTAAQFAEMEQRFKAQEDTIARFQAAEERRGLEQTFSEQRFGEGGRQTLAPASRTALTDALLDVPADKREKVISAVKGLAFAELGERGFQFTEKDPNEVTEERKKELLGMTPVGEAARK